MMKKEIRDRVTLLGMVAACGILILAVVIRFVPWGESLVALPLVIRSLDQECDFLSAVKATAVRNGHNDLIARLESTTRRVATDGELELWSVEGDEYWAPPKTHLAFLVAEQERGVYDGAPIKPGDVVLDCGANVGTYVRHALEGGASLVVALEPVPANVRALQRTFHEEIAAGRVVVYPKGVWDEETSLPMTVFDNNALDSFVLTDRWEAGGRGTATVELPLTTVDQVVAELALSKVDVIKMDVEGAEARALVGASRTLRAHRPRLALATENTPGDVVSLPSIVQGIVAGYDVSYGSCILTGEPRIVREVVFLSSRERVDH